jgi:RNA polymerase sigma-70 factor (ECF subfamily)
VDPRNLLGRAALQFDMLQNVSARTLAQLRGLERAVAPMSATAQESDALVEERALVERARGGDQDAFGVLVRRHQRQVYALALRMLRDTEEASEATQEVFLAAWQGLHGFRGDARFATWLYRIAYNYCLRLAAHRRRDAAVQAELSAASAREQTPERTLSAASAQDAEREMCDTVRGEIANLPPKYRVVVILRHLQELSYEEIAEVLRVPIGTVKTHLFRARAMLKERLENLGRAREEGLARAEGLRAGIGAGLRGMLDSGRQAPQHLDG